MSDLGWDSVSHFPAVADHCQVASSLQDLRSTPGSRAAITTTTAFIPFTSSRLKSVRPTFWLLYIPNLSLTHSQPIVPCWTRPTIYFSCITVPGVFKTSTTPSRPYDTARFPKFARLSASLVLPTTRTPAQEEGTSVTSVSISSGLPQKSVVPPQTLVDGISCLDLPIDIRNEVSTS